MLFDDEESSSGADDEDAGANSRTDNHHVMHSDIAQEAVSIADIKGVGFEIAQRSRPK